MADYSDAYASQCSGCGAWSGHTPNCPSPYMQKVRAIGKAKLNNFEPAEITGGNKIPEKWKCLSGCGTIVWDMETHRKNVCK